jgi:hypothetical protein
VLLLPLAALLLPTTLVLLVGVLPTLAAYLVDRTPGRGLTTSVGLLNVCGTLPALAELWRGGHSMMQANAVLADPFLWLVAYGAAGLGWLVVLMLPPLLRTYYALTTEGRVKLLEQRQEHLREVWGPEVTETAPKAAQPRGPDQDA